MATERQEAETSLDGALKAGKKEWRYRAEWRRRRRSNGEIVSIELVGTQTSHGTSGRKAREANSSKRISAFSVCEHQVILGFPREKMLFSRTVFMLEKNTQKTTVSIRSPQTCILPGAALC